MLAKEQHKRSSQLNPAVIKLVHDFKDREFWCGSLEDPNPLRPCFNHSIGLPRRGKNQEECPIFDYQSSLVNTYLTKRFVWVKKAKALGISEITMRFMAWLGICQNYKYAGTNMLIICGPREKMAIELVNRLRDILRPLANRYPGLIADTEKTVCKFANVRCIALPSNHLHDALGWTEISLAYSDESDFYSVGQMELLRPILESYIAKQNKSGTLYLIYVSTPNLPHGLFWKMEHDENPDFLYERVFLPYTVGIGKIYDNEMLELAKKNPEWQTNFCLSYGFGTGTVFRHDAIENCISDYDTELYPSQFDNTIVNIGADPGAFGTTGSKFGIVASCVMNNQVYILDAIELSEVTIDTSVQVVVDLIRNKYGFYQGKNNIRIFCDKQFPAYITALKTAIRDGDYNQQQEYCKQHHLEMASIAVVSGVSFAGDDGRNLLFNLQSIVNAGDLKIHKKYDQLIMQMRIAKTLVNGHLDKSQNSLDLIDAASLSLSNINRSLQ